MIENGNLNFLNVSYFFRLLYDLATGGNLSAPGVNLSLGAQLAALLSSAWLTFVILSILASFAALAVLIHATIRMLEVKRLDAVRYATVAPAVAEERRDHSRWTHVIDLVESPHENDWRQAIIEADIMLDDLLAQLGYGGIGTGEKLRAADPARFHTLNDAWEAHKVRNEIAHKGSEFQLTDHLAYRTIHLYENVMREHGEI